MTNSDEAKSVVGRCLCGGVLALWACATPAQGYPTRVVRIIAPTAAGASNDVVSRLLAQGLSERLGRQVVVENRPGASTMIGTEAVANAAPDGHTLLMAVVAFAINPSTYKKMTYDALRDFAPVTQAVFATNLMIVHPSVPAKTVREFIALAKSRPGEILYAASGYGTNSHLAMELFASMAQISIVMVPYKGSTPGVLDVIAGHVSVTSTTMASGLSHVKSGKLRALGVSSLHRVAAAPDIPTIDEAGLPGYEAVQWSGMLAPAATPRDIINRLHRESAAVLRTRESRDILAAEGSEVTATTPEEFAAFLKTEIVKWAKVVKTAGIKPQ